MVGASDGGAASVPLRWKIKTSVAGDLAPDLALRILLRVDVHIRATFQHQRGYIIGHGICASAHRRLARPAERNDRYTVLSAHAEMDVGRERRPREMCVRQRPLEHGTGERCLE